MQLLLAMRSIWRTTASVIGSGHLKTRSPHFSPPAGSWEGIADQQALHAGQYLHANLPSKPFIFNSREWYVACFALLRMVLRQALPQHGFAQRAG